MQMDRNNIYEGTDPYIFVSYAHKDNERIFPLITGIQESGFRVWYDAGIEAGTEWPQYIAERLIRSKCVIAFVSKASVESKNCAREINYAISKNKPMLVIYLEELELPAGMEMQLGILQAMFYYRHKDNTSFLKSLIEAELLKACKVENEVVNVVVVGEEVLVAEELVDEKAEPEALQEENLEGLMEEELEEEEEAEGLTEEESEAEEELEEEQVEEFIEEVVESKLLQEEVTGGVAETELLQEENVLDEVPPDETDWEEILDYHVYKDEVYIKGLKNKKRGLFFKPSISIIIPGTIKGKKVVVSSNAFKDCANLERVEFLEGITEIEWGTFWNCKNLSSVKLPNSLAEIGESAFFGCKSLTSIEFPKGLKKIGQSAFMGCDKLASVEFPEGLEEIGYCAFAGCKKLMSVKLQEGLKRIGNRAFAYCSLTSVELPEGLEEVGSEAFNSYKLTSVKIPESLKKIGDNAFYPHTIVEKKEK